MSIAVKSGLPSLGSTEGAVISADEVSVSEDGSAAASVGEDAKVIFVDKDIPNGSRLS